MTGTRCGGIATSRVPASLLGVVTWNPSPIRATARSMRITPLPLYPCALVRDLQCRKANKNG
jgi:hypothetical protein